MFGEGNFHRPTLLPHLAPGVLAWRRDGSQGLFTLEFFDEASTPSFGSLISQPNDLLRYYYLLNTATLAIAFPSMYLAAHKQTIATNMLRASPDLPVSMDPEGSP